MVVVAAGSSHRFGSDKLTEVVGRKPLLAHTVDAVLAVVPHCVLVVREDQLDYWEEADLGVDVVAGGATRTASEAAGLAAVGSSTLVGIHDGARPLIRPGLIDELFDVAADVGGAVPVLPPARPLLERETLGPVSGVVRVQTPQVFWGPELRAAFLAAATVGYSGPDTAALVHEFSRLRVATVPGDPGNIKVTYSRDLEQVRRFILGGS